MMTIRRAAERGTTTWEWLDSRHTFSFGDYHDPAHMGFRPRPVPRGGVAGRPGRVVDDPPGRANRPGDAIRRRAPAARSSRRPARLAPGAAWVGGRERNGAVRGRRRGPERRTCVGPGGAR